jgi:hypothetical protein
MTQLESPRRCALCRSVTIPERAIRRSRNNNYPRLLGTKQAAVVQLFYFTTLTAARHEIAPKSLGTTPDLANFAFACDVQLLFAASPQNRADRPDALIVRQIG